MLITFDVMDLTKTYLEYIHLYYINQLVLTLELKSQNKFDWSICIKLDDAECLKQKTHMC